MNRLPSGDHIRDGIRAWGATIVWLLLVGLLISFTHWYLAGCIMILLTPIVAILAMELLP